MKYFTRLLLFLPVIAGLIFLIPLLAIHTTDEDTPDGCTSITVGRLASIDGSVMTSHTADTREHRTWLDIQPRIVRKKGEMEDIYKDTEYTVSAYDLSKRTVVGKIPAPEISYQYINTFLPPMNEYQIAIGESTFGGKDEMKSDKGMINYWELNRLMAARAKTAREAIHVADELTKKYGYNDGGECFTIADTKEVWHLEILGPGKDKTGAVWAARRVPDDHIAVNANGSRIRKIDLSKPDYFMASDNYMSTAIEMGFYDPNAGEPFEFCYAYADRNGMSARRREWRVFDLVAPGLKLDSYAENYPFSVKPENKISVAKVMEIFRDTFEGTEYDMTKYWIVEERDEKGNRTGKLQKSPYANPFMHYDMMPLMKVNGGWDWRGERCIARYYCTYVTVTQSRDWLPREVGGLVWLGYDNPAMTTYAPLYANITDVPEPYKYCGRKKFNRDIGWWAFNRIADFAAQKWGEMKKDVDEVRTKFEEEAFKNQPIVETRALELLKKDRKKAIEYLTKYTNDFANRIIAAYWELGDNLWVKYTGKF